MTRHLIEGYLCRFARDADREQAACWLASQPWVTSHQLAPLNDAWYDPWEDESTTVLSDPHQKETP